MRAKKGRFFCALANIKPHLRDSFLEKAQQAFQENLYRGSRCVLSTLFVNNTEAEVDELISLLQPFWVKGQLFYHDDFLNCLENCNRDQAIEFMTFFLPFKDILNQDQCPLKYYRVFELFYPPQKQQSIQMLKEVKDSTTLTEQLDLLAFLANCYEGSNELYNALKTFAWKNNPSPTWAEKIAYLNIINPTITMKSHSRKEMLKLLHMLSQFTPNFIDQRLNQELAYPWFGSQITRTQLGKNQLVQPYSPDQDIQIPFAIEVLCTFLDVTPTVFDLAKEWIKKFPKFRNTQEIIDLIYFMNQQIQPALLAYRESIVRQVPIQQADNSKSPLSLKAICGKYYHEKVFQFQ